MEKKLVEVKEYIKNKVTAELKDYVTVGGKQRSLGDTIEDKVFDILFNEVNNLITETKPPRSDKSMEDITLISDEYTFWVDIKTHNVNRSAFPNMTAIEKIKKVLHKKNEELIYVSVNYELKNNKTGKIVKGKPTQGIEYTVFIKSVDVFYVWELDMSILTIGNLGKGQLQIKDANKELVFTDKGKELWYLDFKKLVLTFLKNQIIKTNKQILEWQ
jgi:hypothetical protein